MRKKDSPPHFVFTDKELRFTKVTEFPVFTNLGINIAKKREILRKNISQIKIIVTLLTTPKVRPKAEEQVKGNEVRFSSSFIRELKMYLKSKLA